MIVVGVFFQRSFAVRVEGVVVQKDRETRLDRVGFVFGTSFFLRVLYPILLSPLCDRGLAYLHSDSILLDTIQIFHDEESQV